MPITSALAEEAHERYRRERDRYVKMTRLIEDMCHEKFREEQALRVAITSRTKAASSFRNKRYRFMGRQQKAEWNTVDDVFSELSDFSGVRVIYYSATDADRIEVGLREMFGDDLEFDRKDRLQANGGAGANYYRATHCQVRAPDGRALGDNENLVGLTCEIQICSMMEHVWNEIEHDISYKPVGELGQEELDALADLGKLSREGDKIIGRLVVASEGRVEKAMSISAPHELVPFLASVFAIGRVTFYDNCRTLFEALQRLGLLHRDAFVKVLGIPSTPGVEDARRRALWDSGRAEITRFNAYLTASGHKEIALKPRKSADPALMLLIMRQYDDILEALPAGRGRGRPSRIRTLAYHYREYRKNAD